MCLSRATLVGLSYGLSLLSAQVFALFSVEEARRTPQLGRAGLVWFLMYSILWSVLIAGSVLAIERLFGGDTKHPLCMNPLVFAAGCWLIASIGTAHAAAIKQVRDTTGRDVLAANRHRVLFVGWMLGMSMSFFVVFVLT